MMSSNVKKIDISSDNIIEVTDLDEHFNDSCLIVATLPVISKELSAHSKQISTNVDEVKMNDDVNNNIENKSSRYQNVLNIIFLLYLYFLQGITLGFAISIPSLIEEAKKTTRIEQEIFNLTSWLFLIKLLWAPFFDVVYIQKLGRRKTWLFMCLFIIGISFIWFAYLAKEVLDPNEFRMQTYKFFGFTSIFTLIVFMTTIQDIVTNGWSLELLSKGNLHWQSTSYIFGINLGIFIGKNIFLSFVSSNYYNKYFRVLFRLPIKDQSILSVEYIFYAIAIISLLSSLIILIFKKEVINLNETDTKNKIQPAEFLKVKQTKNTNCCHVRMIFEAYRNLMKIFLLPQTRILIFIFFTIEFAFSTENIIRAKYSEAGVNVELINFFSIITMPVLIILSALFSKYLNKTNTLNFLRITIVLKFFAILIIAIFAYFTPLLKDNNDLNSTEKSYPYIFYFVYVLLNIINSMFTFLHLVSMGSYFAQISDRAIGGTYMSFLYLWPSLGSILSKTIVSFLTYGLNKLVPIFDVYCQDNLIRNVSSQRVKANGSSSIFHQNKLFETSNSTSYSFDKVTTISDINNYSSAQALESADSYLTISNQTFILFDPLDIKCFSNMDMVYPLTILILLMSIIWLIFTRKLFRYLRNLSYEDWLIVKKKRDNSSYITHHFNSYSIKQN